VPTGNVGEDSIGFAEAEQLSGLSRGILRRLIRNGQLRATKVGRATRIDKHSLEAFFENYPTQPKLSGFDEVD
jgi:excisionase family DNA binding protein